VVTLGSFNNNCKLNEDLLGLWACLLQKDERLRIYLKFKGGDNSQIRDHYLEQFGRQGVGADRVRIEGWKSGPEHLASYNDVDLALDTCPYNGTTTTCEAIWMGVPTLTLVGHHHASRVGQSLLHRLGLEAFVATSPDEYLNKAVSFSRQMDDLATIRRTLRPLMLASPLCDAGRLCRHLEAAFRQMWLDWSRRQ
jgi:predicted O-linked N-acetylglucosamine transferase (SPINDLY family)